MLTFDDIEDTFKIIVAPEYAEIDDETLELFFDEALCEVAVSKWGCRAGRAVSLIMAHLIAMSKKSNGMGGNSATGQLVKTKVGDLERQFADGTNNGKDGSYGLTTYGVEFLRLRKQIIKTPVFVSC